MEIVSLPILFQCKYFCVNYFVLIHPNVVYLKEGPTNLHPYILIFQ